MTRVCSVLLLAGALAMASDRLVVEGKSGPGKGKHIVLVAGDEEYRSEEMLPALARILAGHGFECTVLFAIDRNDGTINPDQRDNIPGLELLGTADLLVLMTRWRNLPDGQMEHFDSWIRGGRPVIGIRTATHAFKLDSSPTFKRWSSDSQEWDGGFGRQILGETWIAHHGQHGKQSTRALIVKGEEKHPILRGIGDGEIWVPTDVYRVRLPLFGDSKPLLLGQVLAGMSPSDGPAEGKQNDPMMPVAWTKTYEGQTRTGRVFTTTMGSAQDFSNAAFRRLLVNACYWTLGMEAKIKAGGAVELVGSYQPSPFKFNGHREGVKPDDLK